MKFFTTIAMVGALALAACHPGTDGGVNNANTPVLTAQEQVTLKSTTALSLAELGFNSAEQIATKALQSGHMSKADAAKLGKAVHDARNWRNQARVTVAGGGDASAVLENLNTALGNIALLTAGNKE